jgi:putative heme-binding domain-containing protein
MEPRARIFVNAPGSGITYRGTNDMRPAGVKKLPDIRFLKSQIPNPKLHRLLGRLFSTLMLLSALGGQAAELSVRDGLVLWLDVSAQPAARAEVSLPAIRHLRPVDFLLDSSGAGRQAVQPVAERRPLFISDGQAAYLEFDGENDFLAVNGPRISTPELTLFVLAAPKSNPGIVHDTERRAVEQSLLAKTPALHALLHGGKGHALETVKDPPVVQMLVPGFTVRELPLKIKNLNNVRYRHDGKLVALGYNGHIYLLSDTNGDGLEDKVEVFWDQPGLRGPIGIALTPKDDPRGDGVFVASKGKVSLILDKDHDGKADEEIIAATGWPEIVQNVDTVGVAIDPRDGSIYFGVGCANYADGYLIDRASGQSRYDLQSIRGTIQRLSADFSKLETVCTGVRFTCALAFNRHGDLFATEQEGATWLPNGNPFDELLHIQPGKHYGFPPRHPKHLPGVIDEPAVFEYAPQHQSTVGLVFNEGVNGGPHFGPAHWEGDALVCGQARGKLWRTQLAKTPLGYVAQNHLIASLTMLATDACVSPEGDLVVVCHSGPPDWGTGPAGEGRIFKISYTGRALPQPVHAWAAAADEFRIAFDRPLDPADWVNAREQVKIEAGEFVRAADRFEIMRPGYQVVRDQMGTPRRWVEVLGLSLREDHRTIVLRIPRQTKADHYAITLPLPEKWRQTDGITQHPQIDLLVTMNGIAASVAGPDGQELRSVLPHPSLEASAIFTAGSAEHEAFLKLTRAQDATLTLRGSVDVSNPFVPAVQPGSKLDWDMAADPFASALFAVHTDYAGETEAPLEASAASKIRRLKELVAKNPSWSANGLFLAKDALHHPVSTARLYLPWTGESSAPAELAAKERTDVKGNWLRGRRLYFSEAGCATCHTIRGEGIAFGPDLSNLIHRDRASVLHDIVQPSATINPDQTGTLVTLKDRTVHSGIVRSLTDQELILALPAGAQVTIPRAEIAGMEPMKNSLMPEGLIAELTPDQVEDLLAFLFINPLEPAPITRTDPPMPPARRVVEIIDLLGSLPTQPVVEQAPLRILLCAGPKTHGVNEHDYPLWLERWSRLLALGENVTVTTAPGFPSAGQLEAADVAVFYNANPAWIPSHAARLDQFHKRGGGVVYIHWAINGVNEPDVIAERTGLSTPPGTRYRHGEIELIFTNPEHPITRGFSRLRLTDETYWNLRGEVSRLKILGEAVEENAVHPQIWTLERQRSRIVGFIPGHYTWSFDDPLFRLLVLRSICWTAGQPEDRLSELITIGARMAE